MGRHLADPMRRVIPSPVSVRFGGADGASGSRRAVGEIQRARRGRDHPLGDVQGQRRQLRLELDEDQVRLDRTDGHRHADPKARVNGWYNHPVEVAFTGADGGSGSTSAHRRWRTGARTQPGEARRRVPGRRRSPERADDGRASVRRHAARQPNVKWVHRGTSISLAWTAGKDVVQANVVRAAGLKGKKPGVIYQANGRKLVDRQIRRAQGTGTRYRCTTRRGTPPQDGRAAGRLVGILAPAAGAVVKPPPVVEWSAVEEARFYNVQLWRGKVKLLTTWVRSPKLEAASSGGRSPGARLPR